MKDTALSLSASVHLNSLSGTELKRRWMLSTPATLSASVGDMAGNKVERKGLFETDDDAGDSLEAFREQVKLRQSKKQSEIKMLRAQLETAQQRAEELETRIFQINKEKEEFAIRTNECHRIIEKRNKQLLKASEKMTRQSEQYDSQTAELQTKLAAISAECTQLRADAATIEESTMRERALKERELQKELETQRKKYEKALQAAEARVDEKLAENMALVKKICEVEQELAITVNQKSTTLEVTATEEYRSLLRKLEDTEAIVRGLNYHLEKEQQEKKYLQKKLTALYDIKGVRTKDDADGPKDSPASVVTSDAGLASIDFTGDEEVTLDSPKATKAVTSVVAESFTPLESSPSPTRSRSRGLSASSFIDDAPKPTIREGKRRATSVQMSKTVLEFPEKPRNDKALVSKSKSMATSVTFFGKLSSKFKRASSPRNGLQMRTDSFKTESNSVDIATPSENGFVSSVPTRQEFAYNKVLRERPRMYVAKSPSCDDDESSDSIFGSESLSSSSDDMPPPPPPPPISFTPSAEINLPPQLSAMDSSADTDASCSSHDTARQERRNAPEKQVQLSTRTAEQEENGYVGALQTPSGTSVPSSSSSSSSDDDSSESDAETTQARYVGTKKVETLLDSSLLLSSSSGDENAKLADGVRLNPDRKTRHGSFSILDDHKKRSSRSPSRSKSRKSARSVRGAEAFHCTSRSRMNEYMEARARKRNEKIKRTQQKEYEETIKKEEYEKEWEKMAQEERERKRKQQQARRNGRRRPASMKTVRVSQMRQQMNNKQQQKEQKDASMPWQSHINDLLRPHGSEGVDVESRPSHRKSETKTSGSEAEEERVPIFSHADTPSPPLPPEPAIADTELYLRQQARLRERHEMQLRKKIEADEADAVRGEIHRRVEMWAFGKELLHMILTLDQISSNDGLKKCQLMVVQSPDDDTVRKAYRYVPVSPFTDVSRCLKMFARTCRNIIRIVHPDKLRGATIPEQLEAKELFTVLNQAFEKFKTQAS
ncbi:hypothetical protein PsorP6_004068 [Peronosclerospora sorghi]|uniref:Uncharacterized protein n=1 Tax=Peronosclerospora sorghi TaxID=230839 RepID=A0ACC0VLC1_9STRA|nr:hypothetical protein PsorP6_004068 [Peronosclerospora sorghi]